MNLKSICVFCGSNTGEKEVYRQLAISLGEKLASEGIKLVYGGGKVGLMGALADAALEAGGEVVGVIPHGLHEREVGHTEVTKLHVVDTMHERKALMAELAQGFIAMPGGMGTLEEFCEILTWSQLGIHGKPVALLEVNNYYQPLVKYFDHMVAEGFVKALHRSLFTLHQDIDELLSTFRAYEAPPVEKWLDSKSS